MTVIAPPFAPELALGQFRADVVAGLGKFPKQIPCKYFYDETGSRLFERICELDEYYLTRAELEIMQVHAREMAELLGPRCLLIEYGSGSSLKTRHLLDHLAAPAAYVPIDVSAGPLCESAEILTRRYPGLEVLPLCADFTQHLDLPCSKISPRRRVVYFPGSTIGNLMPSDAIALFRRTAELCGTGGGMLLGVDLKKDERVLHAAYNDRGGVTAAFNLNLLARINRELGADFQLSQFAHQAFYNAGAGRIEMQLVSQCDQVVHVNALEFPFRAGEAVCTEYSYKYACADLQQRAAAGSFRVRRLWYDQKRSFCVAYLTVHDDRLHGGRC
jgi:dimethylhistidine N-methyltransferase